MGWEMEFPGSQGSHRCSNWTLCWRFICGSPGKAADLVAFDLRRLDYAGALHDPVAALVFCTPRNVTLSIINGKVVVEDGRLIGVDLGRLVARHNELSRELVIKAGEG